MNKMSLERMINSIHNICPDVKIITHIDNYTCFRTIFIHFCKKSIETFFFVVNEFDCETWSDDDGLELKIKICKEIILRLENYKRERNFGNG